MINKVYFVYGCYKKRKPIRAFLMDIKIACLKDHSEVIPRLERIKQKAKGLHFKNFTFSHLNLTL